MLKTPRINVEKRTNRFPEDREYFGPPRVIIFNGQLQCPGGGSWPQLQMRTLWYSDRTRRTMSTPSTQDQSHRMVVIQGNVNYSFLRLVIKVGMHPTFSTFRFLLKIYLKRDSPRAPQLKLSHTVWCALASHARISRSLFFLQ